MMTPSENKRIVRRLTEAWNDRDRETWLSVHADEVTVTRPRSDSDVIAAEELWAAEESGLFATFPDVTASIEGLLAEDDQVLVLWRITGTHEGEFHGIAPTGDEIEYAEWALYRVADGQVTAARFLSDALDLFDQLGAVDPPTD